MMIRVIKIVGLIQLKSFSDILMANRLSSGWRKIRPIKPREIAFEMMFTQRDWVKSLTRRVKVETANWTITIRER